MSWPSKRGDRGLEFNSSTFRLLPTKAHTYEDAVGGPRLILTRFQPGDQRYLILETVSTVYLFLDNAKPLKRLRKIWLTQYTRLKPGENEIASKHLFKAF